MKNMKKFILAATVTMLAGCASTGVVPVGVDVYMIGKQGGSFLTASTSLKAEAFQEANNYCAEQNKTMQVVSSKEIPAGLAQFPQAEVQFKCASR